MSGTCWLSGLSTSLCSEPLTSSQTTISKYTQASSAVLVGRETVASAPGCGNNRGMLCISSVFWSPDLPRIAKPQLIVFAGRHVSPACRQQRQKKSPQQMGEVHHSLHLLFREFVLSTSTPRNKPTVSLRARMPCQWLSKLVLILLARCLFIQLVAALFALFGTFKRSSSA